MGNGSDAINNYQKNEKKWKRDLKALKNQRKIIFSMDKKSGLRREHKKIKKIKEKSSKKCSYSSSNSSSSDSDSGSSLFSDSE